MGSKPLIFLNSSIAAILPYATPIGAATSQNPLEHHTIRDIIPANLSSGEFRTSNLSLLKFL